MSRATLVGRRRSRRSRGTLEKGTALRASCPSAFCLRPEPGRTPSLDVALCAPEVPCAVTFFLHSPMQSDHVLRLLRRPAPCHLEIQPSFLPRAMLTSAQLLTLSHSSWSRPRDLLPPGTYQLCPLCSLGLEYSPPLPLPLRTILRPQRSPGFTPPPSPLAPSSWIPSLFLRGTFHGYKSPFIHEIT